MKKISTKPTFDEEQKLWNKGYDYVIGLDEVGRGCFAGPVTVGGVVFRKSGIQGDALSFGTRRPLADIIEIENIGINDSKQVKPNQRIKLSKFIKENSFFSATETVPVGIINKIGIGKATHMAFRRVINKTMKQFNSEQIFILIDGFHVKYIKGIGLKNQKAIIKGDQKSISIAAASIIAKVHRDKLMKNLSKRYPEYNFGKNKGYGTKEHRDAIKKHGLSKLHRTSFNLEKFI